MSWISVPLGVTTWCVTHIFYFWNVNVIFLSFSLPIQIGHDRIRFACVGSHSCVLVHVFVVVLMFGTCGLILLHLVWDPCWAYAQADLLWSHWNFLGLEVLLAIGLWLHCCLRAIGIALEWKYKSYLRMG